MHKQMDQNLNTKPFSLFNDEEIYLFRIGKNYRLYDRLGSHCIKHQNINGVQFAVWAPNAKSVSVVGDFNGWNEQKNFLFSRWDSSGIWEGFIPEVKSGDLYKYKIITKDNKALEKTDPFAFKWEGPPKTASIVWDIDYEWSESEWIKKRAEINALDRPISIYELHYASWIKNNSGSITYLEMAKILPPYLKKMGFTHVEFLPIMEHPFEGSWGYQTLGYFAPTSRFGTPQEFMMLIEALHAEDIGIYLDWVPSHFPGDEHGIAQFDGTCLYEHVDPRKGFHPDWKSMIFNYGRSEVVSFLISSALFWFEKYHIDGLRVDAVASMLYLDYSRKEGEWIPNQYGGNENLEAIEFLRELNKTIYQNYPYAQTIAEESTAWPMVSRPTYLGGLGFGMKWNMGWMHDTLEYFSKDPIYRKHHQGVISFSMIYAFNENFILPLSHDEVVYGKGSLLSKMPGDEWQKFANLRLLLGYMYMHPGKKLLFMGAELALWNEWNHNESLPWFFKDYDRHEQIGQWIKDLNHIYRSHPALYELDFSSNGFRWIDLSDSNKSVLSFLRLGKSESSIVIIICNFTPMMRENYKIGVPKKGKLQEILNSDSEYYGGSNKGNMGSVSTLPILMHGFEQAINITLPPLAIIVFKYEDS